MKRSKIVAFMGAIASMFPTAAIAQTAPLTPTDIAYLNDLYYYLGHEDALTYNMATQAVTKEDHILVAQTFCQAFEAGTSPADTFMTYLRSVIDEVSRQGQYVSEDLIYAFSLHSSMAMAVGTTYYCPQYQQQVAQDLEFIANGSRGSTFSKPAKF